MLVATDAYDMGIDNPDVCLVIQWDILILFDLMIQKMGRAERKDAQSTFVFFLLKWLRIEANSDKIKKQVAHMDLCADSASLQQASSISLGAKAQKPNHSLSQVLDIDTDVSDTEFVAESIGESEAINFDNNEDLIFSFLATEANKN